MNKVLRQYAYLAASATLATSLIGQQSLAKGSNTTSPAPTPPTPAPVITSSPARNTVGEGGCKQQYTGAINSHIDSANSSDKIGLAAEVVGVTAEGVFAAARTISDGEKVAEYVSQTAEFVTMGAGLAEAAVGVVVPLDAGLAAPGLIVAGGAAEALALSTGFLGATTTAEGVASAAEVIGLASSETGVVTQVIAAESTEEAHDLSKYMASLPDCNATHTGTVQVSAGGVNVTGDSIFNDDVGVAADVNVEGDLNTSQVHATQGISAVGGGIWIGDPNGTTFSDGITIGGGALSGAGVGGAQAFTGDVDAIAIGNNAQAMTSGSVALGLDSSSAGADAVAIGTAAAANGVQDVVVGALNNTDVGGNNTVVGNEIDIMGAASSSNTVLGVGHQVTGSGNFVGGDPITVTGSNNVAIGANGSVTGDSNVAIGDTVNITGDRAIAVGDNATATGDDTTVVGTNAQANATGSAAFGQGAVANQAQQQVFGTQANTYTAPGIPSNLSRSRQSGSLEVVTSDASGNLATDGGDIYKTMSENQAGIAIAMAITTPQIRASERFAIALNWGMYQESQAIAFSAAGVVANNVFGGGGRLSLNAGVGLSVSEKSFGGQSANNSVGGRVGVQLSW